MVAHPGGLQILQRFNHTPYTVTQFLLFYCIYRKSLSKSMCIYKAQILAPYKTPSVRLLLHTTRAVMASVTSTGTPMNGARTVGGGSWRRRPFSAHSAK